MRSEINAVSGFRILLLRFWEFLESPPHTELTLGPISLHSMIWLPYFCNHTPLLTLSNLWKFFLHLGGSRICRIRIRGFMTLCGVCVEFMACVEFLTGQTLQSFWGWTRMTLVGGSRHIDGRGGWTPTQPTCTNLPCNNQTAQQKVKGLKNFFCFWEIFEGCALKKFRFSQEWSWPHWSSTSVSSPYPQCK